MTEFNRRDFLKIAGATLFYPKNVLWAIEETQENIYKVISFNTQRNERLEQLKIDLKKILLLNIKSNNKLIIWLQEVSENIYVYLSNLCDDLWLTLIKSWENVSVFSNQLETFVNDDIILPWNRKFQNIKTWIKNDNISFLNWDFQHWFEPSRVLLRSEQFDTLLSKLQEEQKIIITLDTNFVFPREMWLREDKLWQNNFRYSKQDLTYDVWRLEINTMVNRVWKEILSIIMQEAELDKIFVKWFTIKNQWIYKDIISSDHYPLFAEIS